MNNLIKWKYDKKFKQWYLSETKPYANDSFTIERKQGIYRLEQNYDLTLFFKKLSSAKKVAELIRLG